MNTKQTFNINNDGLTRLLNAVTGNLRDYFQDPKEFVDKWVIENIQPERSQSSLPAEIVKRIDGFVDTPETDESEPWFVMWEDNKNNPKFKDKRDFVEQKLAEGKPIHSVTTEEGTFTVEDDTNMGTIVKFRISNGELQVDLKRMSHVEVSQWFKVDDLRKPTKPKVYLTTTDNVEVTDEMQHVFTWEYFEDEMVVAERNVKTFNRIYQGKREVFSTEEAAKSFISRHAKTLSIEDVEKACPLVFKKWKLYEMHYEHYTQDFITALTSKTNG